MAIRLEHLPADTLSLSALARTALATGEAGGIRVARRTADVTRPADRHDSGERGPLVDGIRPHLEALDAPERVQTSLNVLRNEGTLAVVTGQQPGFLTAPLYSLYKALQACRLAGELSGAWGTPVVPIFWNHADDHDLAEVNHAYQVNRNNDLQKIGVTGMSSSKKPISAFELDDERHGLGATRAAVEQMYGNYPHIAEATELFFPRQGETLARALSRIFTALLGTHGLVVIEPDWIRAPLSRALADVVATDPLAALVRGTEALEAPAIDPHEAALVFRVDADGRHALRAGGEGFRYDGEAGSRTPAELAAEIVDDPAGFSPGALLRPLAQDAVFPTCAYVGGWGELAYHAQLGPVRDACALPRTVFVPRVSCTLVEPEVRGALGRVETDLRTVLAAAGEFAAQADDAPPPVIAKLRAVTEDVQAAILAHRAELAELDPALGVNLKRAASRAKGSIEKVLQKAERVYANKFGKGARHVRRLNNTLMPLGRPQERVLGPLAFSARWTPQWIEDLYAELPAVASEHLVVHIDGPNDEEKSA
ncbi:MAG: bacillithiol biosynthesis cysteine-adding enzyme BshC [bacterium]|nr:bacillithiol biosynthesis cysteine-adding enzyme BshC [bacterium]